MTRIICHGAFRLSVEDPYFSPSLSRHATLGRVPCVKTGPGTTGSATSDRCPLCVAALARRRRWLHGDRQVCGGRPWLWCPSHQLARRSLLRRASHAPMDREPREAGRTRSASTLSRRNCRALVRNGMAAHASDMLASRAERCGHGGTDDALQGKGQHQHAWMLPAGPDCWIDGSE